MIKLKNLYNEIKLVPSNRILLQREGNNYYFLDYINDKRIIYKSEIQNNKNLSFGNEDIIPLLKSKNIPYKISNNLKIIHIDIKYFIFPDKLNEIKLVSMSKLPKKIKIYDEEDINKYPNLKLHIITKEENIDLNKYLKEIDGSDYTYENVEGMTVYDAAKKLDYDSGYLEEWFTTIINGIFPDIITDTPYGTND